LTYVFGMKCLLSGSIDATKTGRRIRVATSVDKITSGDGTSLTVIQTNSCSKIRPSSKARGGCGVYRSG